MQIAFCVTLLTDGWANWHGKLLAQKIVALAGLVSLACLPALFYVVLRRKQSELWRPSVKAQIGSLYLGIKTESQWALTYSVVFMLRRSLFVALMFGLQQQPAIQMNLFIYSSNLYLIYLQHVLPYDDSATVLAETCNEAMLLMICYHFILLSDLLADPALKFQIGWSLCGFVLAMILFNLAIIVFVSLRQCCQDLKRRRALKLRA